MEREPILDEEWEQVFLREPEQEAKTHIEMDEHGYIIDIINEEEEPMTLFDSWDEREYTDKP